MALSICFWANYTQNKVKLTRMSENAVNSDHVLQFLFDEETAVVNAVVQASMRDTSYRVRVYLGENFNVSRAECGCEMGDHECHHVAAALLYGFKCVRKTDVKCARLKKPRSRKLDTVNLETMETRKPAYRTEEVQPATHRESWCDLTSDMDCKPSSFLFGREASPVEVPERKPPTMPVIQIPKLENDWNTGRYQVGSNDDDDENATCRRLFSSPSDDDSDATHEVLSIDESSTDSSDAPRFVDEPSKFAPSNGVRAAGASFSRDAACKRRTAAFGKSRSSSRRDRADVKRRRALKTCPVDGCGQAKVDISQHLRHCHRHLTASERSQLLLMVPRAVRPSPAKEDGSVQRKSSTAVASSSSRFTCSLCRSQVKRIGLHVRQRHGLSTGSQQYAAVVADSKAVHKN